MKNFLIIICRSNDCRSSDYRSNESRSFERDPVKSQSILNFFSKRKPFPFNVLKHIQK